VIYLLFGAWCLLFGIYIDYLCEMLVSNFRILLCLSGLIIISACNSYQKVVKSTDMDYKYVKAKEFYNKKQYYKALPLLEEQISVYRGKKNIEEALYYYAYSQYGLRNFLLAAFHFNNLAQTYPNSKYAEECRFLYAKCYYLLSPKYSLDQTYSFKAIEALQLFTNYYPESERVEEANETIDEIRKKLQRKAFYNAELYYKVGKYKSASLSFNNILKDFPDTPDKERIYLLILKSHFYLAQKSIESKKAERYKQTIQSYYNFVDKFPNSKFVREVENIYQIAINKTKPKSNEG